jgi:hypothetical protein
MIVDKIITHAYWLKLKTKQDVLDRISNIPDKYKIAYGGGDNSDTIFVTQLGLPFKKIPYVENKTIKKTYINPQKVSLSQLKLYKLRLFYINEFLRNGFEYIEPIRVARDNDNYITFGNGNHRIAHLIMINYNKYIPVDLIGE